MCSESKVSLPQVHVQLLKMLQSLQLFDDLGATSGSSFTIIIIRSEVSPRFDKLNLNP